MSRVIKFAIFFGLVLAGGLALNAISDPDLGSLTLELNGVVYERTIFEASLMLVVAVIVLLVAVAVVRFGWTLAMFILGDENAFSNFFARSRERKGLDSLSKGLLAVASGDGKTALKKAKIAEKNLQRPELTRLLNAKAAELAGDSARAQTYYKALMSEEQTAFAGAQGLLGQAMAEEDTDRALKLAEHAHELMPRNELAMETLYTLQSQKFDWAGARKTVQEQKKYGLLPKEDATRREAALVFAQAEDAEREGKAEDARKLSVEAAKMDPSNVEAVSGAVRHLLEDGSKRAASKLIVEAWRIQPHPKLAAAYAAVEPDEAPAARRRRFETLFALQPDSDEVQFLRAELALVAEDWGGARKAIEDLRETEPSARSCAVFAAIARGEGQPDYVVQGWLARGLGAPRTAGSDSAISNAAMLPLLMGSADTEAMNDVTEPDAGVDESDAGSGSVDADVSDAEVADADVTDPDAAKKPETVS